MSHELHTEEDKKMAKKVLAMNNERFDDSFGTHSEKGLWISRIEARDFLKSELSLLLQEILEKKIVLTRELSKKGSKIPTMAVSVKDILSIMKERGL